MVRRAELLEPAAWFLQEMRGTPSPERRLWSSVIIRAIIDYLQPGTTEIYESAKSYLFYDGTEEHSLRWVLQALDCDEDFQTRLLAQLSSGAIANRIVGKRTHFFRRGA